MYTNNESMRKEAINRMQTAGLNQECINRFETDGKLMMSDHGMLKDVPENIMKEIEQWQQLFNNLVYHVIHGDFICQTYECLSVSCYPEDWEYEREIMNDGWIMSHSINIANPEYTESGSIKVKNDNGILRRIG